MHMVILSNIIGGPDALGFRRRVFDIRKGTHVWMPRLNSEGRIRTADLWLMRPSSCQTAPPRISAGFPALVLFIAVGTPLFQAGGRPQALALWPNYIIFRNDRNERKTLCNIHFFKVAIPYTYSGVVLHMVTCTLKFLSYL